MGDLRTREDALPGGWIASRLGGEFGAVTRAVPAGFEAYARICHPASDRDGRSVSWSEVADVTDRTAHPLMQWHALVGSPDPFNFKGSVWPGGDPDTGNLAPAVLETLCGLLGEHTTAAADCFFGVWEGWGWVELGSIRLSASSARRAGVKRIPIVDPGGGGEPAFSTQELSRPRLELPGRDYVLLSGPLSASTQIGDPGLDGFAPQSPNLLWPADHAWFLASEVDFDSTLVGGSAGLIREILEAPGLDAWPVAPDDSLAYDADHINKVP
jgi:hypothetical protein